MMHSVCGKTSSVTTFRQITATLCDRVYPKRPTVEDARAALVEAGTAEPSDRMIEELRDDADDLIDAWLRDEAHESDCDSAASLHTELDYI